MTGVGVVGYGYWGPLLARNFSEIPHVRLVGICDVDPARLKLAQSKHPNRVLWTDFDEMIADRRIDAVAIATSVASHFELARAALRAGKHVLVEKPLAANSEQVRILIDDADSRGLVLMVDHTFLYTPAVRKIKELIDAGALGELYYFDSVRVNLGLFRHDVNVIWDLAVHDLAIMDYLLPASPVAVSAVGMAHVPGEPENLAHLTYFFEGRLTAHIHVNWLAPVKLRSTLVGGSRKMVVYDDLEASDKIKVYDKGVSVAEDPEALRRLRFSYRSGDMTAPHLATTEALRTELEHFLECITKGTAPLTDGEQGLRVVRHLEAASHSLALRGMPIELQPAAVSL